MSSTLFKIPVISFRKIENPYEKNGEKTYIAVVNVKNIPEEFERWRKLNPRDPKLTSVVAVQIFNTLKDDPDSFFFRNRGITLIAEHALFNNKTNEMELEMTSNGRNGLLDGGHTFRVIRKFVGELPEDELRDFNAYVKLEILEGIKDFDAVIDIVESRNTSTQVKDQSLEELRKHYESIKEVLHDKNYKDRIAYKEFELTEEGSPKDIDVKELLSYLTCFDIETFDSNKHPVKSYSTKTSVVQHFSDNKERMLKYVQLLPEILELHDIIYLELPEAYNDQGGKFGRFTGVTEVSNRRMSKTELPFIEKESSYRIPSGFIYPILAAFRNIVKCNAEKCEWKTDPVKLFGELKNELSKRVGEQAIEFRNPNKLGKDMATWRLCYDVVEKETLRRHL